MFQHKINQLGTLLFPVPYYVLQLTNLFSSYLKAELDLILVIFNFKGQQEKTTLVFASVNAYPQAF